MIARTKKFKTYWHKRSPLTVSHSVAYVDKSSIDIEAVLQGAYSC